MCGALQQLTIIPVVLIPFSFTMGHVAPPREKNAGQLEMGLAKRVQFWFGWLVGIYAGLLGAAGR